MILTSEFESNDLIDRFLLLLTVWDVRLENITVGVIVRELEPPLLTAFVVEEFEFDTKLILTGDLGSRGKNEFAFAVEEVGTVDNLSFEVLSFVAVL